MTRTLEDVRKSVITVLRALDDVAEKSFADWKDDVARSFEGEFLVPLREAALQFEQALKVASRIEEEIDYLPPD